LRYAAHDYDSAAAILNEVAFDFLLLWGHYHLVVELYEPITDKITDDAVLLTSLSQLGLANEFLGNIKNAIILYKQGLAGARRLSGRAYEANFLGLIGNTYYSIGEILTAKQFYEQALHLSREVKSEVNEGSWLGNLGSINADLGDFTKAIETYEQALAIDRKSNFFQGQVTGLTNLGHALILVGEFEKAILRLQDAIKLADKIGYMAGQIFSRSRLAEAHLLQNDIMKARSIIVETQQYDDVENAQLSSVLLGIIAIRQNDREVAVKALARAISLAEEFLVKTPEYYMALDTEGLALCGLALIQDKKFVLGASEAFQAARNITANIGVVKRTVILFDELAKADVHGLLAEIRPVIEGKKTK
jgi:tetratricopeptide (TPR) repeat protein